MNRTTVLLKRQVFTERNAGQEVLKVLFLYPQRDFTLTELASLAGVAKSTVNRVLASFLKKELVRVELIAGGRLCRIRANSGNPFMRREKLLFNLSSVYRSGLVEKLESTYRHPRSITLFGSFRRGEDVEGSDIDIAVELTEDVELKSVRLTEFRPLEREMCRPIVIHVFNRRKVNRDLFNSIANGIVLSGFLEVGP